MRYTLVDNVSRFLGQSINVGLTRPVIASFDRVIKKSVCAIAIALIVFCGIDASLGGYGMRATRGILITKSLYVIT